MNFTQVKSFPPNLPGWCFVFLVFGWFANAQVPNVIHSLKPGMKVEGLVIPIYTRPSPEPESILSVSNIHLDFQRKGFFKIGMMPVLVLDGVVLSLRNTNILASHMTQLSHWIQPDKATRVELRNFVLRNENSKTNLLEAGLVRLLPDGSWQLANGVRAISGANLVEIPAANYRLQGHRANSGAQISSLFSLP
jgi:hypothetical protein